MQQDYSDEIDLISYIQVLIKQKYVILVSTILISLIGMFFSQTPTIYKTETLILLSLSSDKKAEDVKIDLSKPNLAVPLYAVLATAPEMTKSLADTLSVFWSNSPELQNATYGLNAEILPEFASTPSPVLVLSVTSQNPEIPITVAQFWSNLFVERHRGLSSGVAKSYYDWVVAQNNTALANLERTEIELQTINANYNNLGIINNEMTLKNSKLEQFLQTFQAMEVDLTIKYNEQNHLKSQLQPLEKNGTWIGFLPTQDLHKSAETTIASPLKKDFLDIINQLSKSVQDSLTIASQNQIEKLKFQSKLQTEIAIFNLNSDINHISNSLETLKTQIGIYQQEEIDSKHKIKNAKIKLQVFEKHLESEKPVLVLGKAITDQALWDRSDKNGILSEQDQKKLSRYKLYSEQINPEFQQIYSLATQTEIEIDLYQNRLAFLDKEIPLLQNEILEKQQQVDSLQIEAFKLQNKLNHQLSNLNQEQERKISPIELELQYLRQMYHVNRQFYMDRKTRLESLNREILIIESDIAFQRLQFSQWRNNIEKIKTVTDSLKTIQNRLTRQSEIFRNTVLYFSKQLEDARISLKQAEGDVQIISQAANIVSIQTNNRFIFFVGIGLLCSIFLAFLLEFVNKARDRLKNMKP